MDIVIAGRFDTKEHRRLSMKDPGRRKGKPAGSHIDDLVALRKAIVLCWRHVHLFNPDPYQYTRVRVNGENIGVTGDCDHCRQPSQGSALFLPMENIGKTLAW